MDCVILFRNTQNDTIGFISDEKDNIAVFHDWNDAVDLAHEHPLLQTFPHQIVELDEL